MAEVPTEIIIKVDMEDAHKEIEKIKAALMPLLKMGLIHPEEFKPIWKRIIDRVIHSIKFKQER